jgi:hypothetical protein
MGFNTDTGSSINSFLRASVAAASILSQQFDLPIRTEHVENALTEALRLKSSIDLLDYSWTRNRILSALDSYDFQRLFPVLLTEIAFDVSMLPPDAPRSLVEQTVKHKGEIRRVYRNDADPFPSNPHAHNLESRYKLHLGTGELYERRRYVTKIPKKDLMAIRMLPRGLPLPELAV